MKNNSNIIWREVKFLLIFASVLIANSSELKAQDEGRHQRFDKEAFLAKRNAFITAEMGLTPEEAEVFIPLCNEWQKKSFEIGRESRRLSKELREKENTSDEDYIKVIDSYVNVNIRLAELEKEYYEKFKTILSPKKLYKYKRAESKFAREFMKDDKRTKRSF